MNRARLTPTQRLVPLVLAGMTGLVALVLVFFAAAILIGAGSTIGLVVLVVLIVAAVGVGTRATRRRRRGHARSTS